MVLPFWDTPTNRVGRRFGLLSRTKRVLITFFTGSTLMRSAAPRVLRPPVLPAFLNTLVLEFLHFSAIDAIAHVVTDVGNIVAIRTGTVPVEEMILVDWLI